MTKRTIISTLILILFVELVCSCKKNNHPSTPDTPVSTFEIPTIDEYIPERLLHLLDSLNVLHRGDQPPMINGNFVAESLYYCIVDKVPESPYNFQPILTISDHYFEFKEQNDELFGVTFKSPHGTPGEIGFSLEQSDTDSTYFIVKDSVALFTNTPIAPPYFKSGKFTPEVFRHAYIIGNGSYFTLYFYEIRRNTSSFSLPLNAVIISGKISSDEEGKTIIEDFWEGIETMTYYNSGASTNLLIQYGYMPTPGDIIISKSPDALVEGCYGK